LPDYLAGQTVEELVNKYNLTVTPQTVRSGMIRAMQGVARLGDRGTLDSMLKQVLEGRIEKHTVPSQSVVSETPEAAPQEEAIEDQNYSDQLRDAAAKAAGTIGITDLDKVQVFISLFDPECQQISQMEDAKQYRIDLLDVLRLVQKEADDRQRLDSLQAKAVQLIVGGGDQDPLTVQQAKDRLQTEVQADPLIFEKILAAALTKIVTTRCRRAKMSSIIET